MKEKTTPISQTNTDGVLDERLSQKTTTDETPTEFTTPAKAPEKNKFFTTGNMAVMGILSAIAYLLYLLPKLIPVFNLPFFPSWLDLQISDLPALLGGFAIGPWASVIIIVIKCALKMPLTSTMCVGELADIIVGIAFVLPASILYKFMKKRKGAIIGMLVGTVSAILFSMLANWLILIPFYAMQFGSGDQAAGMQTIIRAVSTLYEGITVESFYTYYLFLAVIPFNLMRCAICSVITFLIYKPLSKALHWEIKSKKKNTTPSSDIPTAQEDVSNETTVSSDPSEGNAPSSDLH